jgi:hypothetical protein
MDVLMELDSGHIEGALGKEFVARGLCPELSLGYNVTMSKSPAGFLRASNKKVVELSIVRQGARDGCKIRAFTQGAQSQASGALGSLFVAGKSSGGSSSHNGAAESMLHAAKRHKILV